MAGLLLEQAENDEFHLARLEHLRPAPRSSTAQVAKDGSPAGFAERESWAKAPVVFRVTVHVLLRCNVSHYVRYIVRNSRPGVNSPETGLFQVHAPSGIQL